MILERTLTNGDTIKTALLDAERLKKRVTFYTRTRSMIDKFTCRDTENKPITLGRFTISGGLIYYKRGEYDWQTISLDDVLKVEIIEPEQTPEKRELKPGDRTGIYSQESGKEYFFTGKYDTMKYNDRACVFLATDPENKNTFTRWSQQDLERRGFIIPEPEKTPKATKGAFYIYTNSGTIKKDGYIYDSGRNKYGMRTRGFSIAAQPAGVVAREDDPTGKYYDVIIYERELTPAELDHYSLDPLQPSREPGTTLPPGPEKAPETVTEPPTASQEETPLTPHAKPRRALTRPARTASHTSTHGRPKTPYKAKYKAARTHDGPTRTPRFSKNAYFPALVFKNPAKKSRIRFMGPVFEPILEQPHNGGPPPGYRNLLPLASEKKLEDKKYEVYKIRQIFNHSR